MLTIKDVHSRILDIHDEYHHSSKPSIDLNSLIYDLKTTEKEIMPHLEQLQDLGIISLQNEPE